MYMVTLRSKYCDISDILVTISIPKTAEEIYQKIIEFVLKKAACL